MAWAVLVATLNSIPGTALPASGAGVDKVAHFALYGVLGALAARAALAEARGWRPLAAVLGAIGAFGMVDELHQSLVPGRSTDPRDWLADVVGATAGAAATAALMQRHTPDA